MARDLTLSIDVGTGSVRAALVDLAGEILHIATREHDQIVPQFGWAEQRPLDWWEGVSASIRDALAAVEKGRERVAAICACGQMHGAVLVDDRGQPTREAAPLWNDKRTVGLVAAACTAPGAGLANDLFEAAKAVAQPSVVVDPDPAAHERYRELLSEYQEATDLLRPLMQRLAARQMEGARRVV